MNRNQVTVGLALLLGLAVSSATWVFGQRDATFVVPPPPVPYTPPGSIAPVPPPAKSLVPPLPNDGFVVPPAPTTKSVIPPLPPSQKNAVVPPQSTGNSVIPPLPPTEKFVVPPQTSGNPVIPPLPPVQTLELVLEPSPPVSKNVTPPVIKEATPPVAKAVMPPSPPPAQKIVPPSPGLVIPLGPVGEVDVKMPSQIDLPIEPGRLDLNVQLPGSQKLLPEPMGPKHVKPELAKATPPSQPKVAPPEKSKSTPAVTPPTQEIQQVVALTELSSNRQEPAVSLEWYGPATTALNQPTTYQILAKNTGGAPVQNVMVRYPVPAGVRITSSDPSAKSEANILTWSLGELAPAQERRIDLHMVPETKTAINFQATVTFSASSSYKVQVREPKLVVKASAPERVLLGDVATVSLTVSNPGDGAADHVKVMANVPEGLEHNRGKKFEVDLGSLAPGESRVVQLVCMTKSAGLQQIECLASADAGLQCQDMGKVDVIVPRLNIAVNGPKLRYLERHAKYEVVVTNPGTAPANNVSVVQQLPQGFKFVTASGGGRHDMAARTVSWFIGDLQPGESRDVNLEVIPIAAGDQAQKITASASRGLRAESDIVTKVEGLSALLMELVDTEDPVEVGAETAYEIRVTNTGSKNESNLELVCTVPDKMEFRSARCAAGCKFRVEGQDVIFEPLPTLAPRADVVYRVVVRGIAPGDLRFRARIRADGLSEPVLREESTKVYGDDVLPRK